jgi:hypothetical protein
VGLKRCGGIAGRVVPPQLGCEPVCGKRLVGVEEEES